MFSHFIKRDFRDLKLYWGISVACLVLVLLVTAITWFYDPISGIVLIGLGFYLYLFMIFAFVPIGHIFGTTWRSQHYLSRHYLLSLPVNRRKLFYLQQARVLVCWSLPIFIACIMPLVYVAFEQNECWLDVMMLLPVYYGLLVIIVPYVMHIAIYSVFHGEKITRFQSRQERFLRTVLFVFILITSISLVGVPGLFILHQPNPQIQEISAPVLIIDLLFILAFGAYFYFSNRKTWCVTLAPSDTKSGGTK